MEDQVIGITTEIEVYAKIIGAMFPFVVALLTFLVMKHFALTTKVAVMEESLKQNGEADKQREDNFSKIYLHIDEINKTLKQLEIDVRVLAEKAN